MATKTLEAFLRARGYQGGHIFIMLEELNTLPIKIGTDPYKWGCRDAERFEHGSNIASYPVPVNSWEDSDSCLEYIKGLNDTIEKIQKEIEFAIESDSPVDPYF